MNCPRCGVNNWRVLDKRDIEANIRRRRECKECLTRFHTIERIAYEIEPRHYRRHEYNFSDENRKEV